MSELTENKIPVAAIVTMQEDENLNEALLPCGVDILILPCITGKIEDWKASPDFVVFDTRFLPDWQQNWENFKAIEAYVNIPCIALFTELPSFVIQMTFTKQGLFGTTTFDNWNNVSIICASAIVQGKNLKNNQLQSNELNRILSTNYLVLDAKTSQLEKVKNQLTILREQMKKEVLLETNKIINEIENNLKKEYHYQLFKVHFEEVHPLFYKKLLAINNKLTDNNLKILAFLKMGFNNDEISFLLNVSIAAVKKNIQRLKIKLKIKSEASLREFLFVLDG